MLGHSETKPSKMKRSSVNVLQVIWWGFVLSCLLCGGLYAIGYSLVSSVIIAYIGSGPTTVIVGWLLHKVKSTALQDASSRKEDVTATPEMVLLLPKKGARLTLSPERLGLG